MSEQICKCGHDKKYHHLIKAGGLSCGKCLCMKFEPAPEPHLAKMVSKCCGARTKEQRYYETVGKIEQRCYETVCTKCGKPCEAACKVPTVEEIAEKDKQIEALQQEVDRLKGMIQKASDDNDDDMSGSTMATPEQIQTIIKNLTEIAERKAKLKAQSAYKEEAGK